MTTLNAVVTYDKPDLPVVGRATAAANELIVFDQPSYEEATQAARVLKTRYDEIEDMRVSLAKPIDEAKKAVQAIFKPVLEDYAGAIQIVKRTMLEYVSEQERKQREAQAAADKAAREERERLEREAAKAEKKGNVEKAEALREVAQVMPTITVAPTVHQVNGTGVRKTWKAKVFDPLSLVAFIAANPKYLNLITFDVGAMSRVAQALDGAMDFPGVEVYQESTLAVRK